MIKVTVELISAIAPSRDRVLGIAHITNDGIMTNETHGRLGSYVAGFSKAAPKQNQIWKHVAVSGFKRKTRGAWDLLYLALKEAVGDRNP